ncbi:MAG: ATP-binding protein, partial [Angelakisella sp.]
HDFDAAAEAAAAGQGMEEYSRQVRYCFFEQCVGSTGKIATAHTLSDAVETVVFNLVRGTGVKGLCGIPRVRGQIVRP